MRKLLIAALACLCTAGLAAVGGGTAHAAVSGCTGTFQLGPVTFDRPSVNPGQFVTATTTIQNCTDQTQTPNGYWLFQSMVPAGSPPTLCAGNDPYPLTRGPIAPGATYTTSATIDIYSQCNATAIHVSIRLYGPPDVTQSADIPVGTGSTSPPPASCTATYRNLNEWSSGFVGQVTVTNTSGSAVNRWSVTFTYPGDQQVTTSWNAVVNQSGSVVTATNASWDGAIAAGGSVAFGLYGTWGRSDALPVALTCRAS